MATYWLTYPFRSALWKARELLTGGHPGNGSRNPRYPSEAAFHAHNPLRLPNRNDGENDYGVTWYDRAGNSYRLTWIHATGELILAGPDDTPAADGPPIEVIGRIGTQTEVERRLQDWEYVYDPRWARRRAHGWAFPLPPKSMRELREHQKPIRWPAPPPPSTGRTEGVYCGTHTGRTRTVTITDAEGNRPLYHHVKHSPTGFAWGYTGSGPHDLARSILYDRLGYPPRTHAYSRFCKDIIARLNQDFTLTYQQVDHWIDQHPKLFQNPRADPFSIHHLSPG
jgi:hypothetical protein